MTIHTLTTEQFKEALEKAHDEGYKLAGCRYNPMEGYKNEAYYHFRNQNVEPLLFGPGGKR